MAQRIIVFALGTFLVSATASAQDSLGPEFKVNSSGGTNDEFASVASDAQGRVTVAWSRWNGFTDIPSATRAPRRASPAPPARPSR